MVVQWNLQVRCPKITMRKSAHARTFGGVFELKFLRMRVFSSRFLDNGPEISSTTVRQSLLEKVVLAGICVGALISSKSPP